MHIDKPDLVILAIVGAILAGVLLMELLRLVISDVYELLARHAKVKQEIQQIQRTAEKLAVANRDTTRVRDQRIAQRFRDTSALQRLEKECEEFERRRVEVWHDLGPPSATGMALYSADIANSALTNGVVAGMETICPLWRHLHRARVWARTEMDARTALQNEFALADGFTVTNLRQVQGSAPSGGLAARGAPASV
ncbi:hypothetical protein [Nitrospirillum pindoramense]|uniref:Uncharacterized protein n=1 Tax=Nitrospirillum amazonense TaxID=28077 RepID=A0A560GPG7_9PROT|nr:hypothetical protein [Nitrospirillum amazonense]TWB35905.1 hypothetical protein FBZ90_118108 [Nitrospirillum amazonense]